MALIFNNNLLNTLFGRQFNKIGVIPIDVTVSESHQRNQNITRRAIEGGSSKVDNVIILPDTVTMNCIVKSDLLGDSFDEKLNKIDQIRLAREPFDVVTSLGVYENVFFDGPLTINRDVSNNTVLAFTATMTALDFINTETSIVPRAASSRENAPAESLGKKQLVEDTEPNTEKKSSVLFKLTGGIFE